MTFPDLSGVPNIDDKATFEDVGVMTGGVLKHPTKIHFVECAILHAFEQMGAQLEFPGPPH